MKNAYLQTLGCRLNQADSAIVADDLASHGFNIVTEPDEHTSLIVLNSCTVTATAARKSRQTLRGLRRRFPSAYIVIMGCDATVADPQTLPEADAIIPNPRPAPLSQLLPEVLLTGEPPALRPAPAPWSDDFVSEGAGLFAERTRANLKVQDGCDFYCSYCIVPYSRGHARSRNFQDVLREARELIARGHREIVISGVNVTTYDNGGRDLADLLEALLALDDVTRYRLGSAEPGPVIAKIIPLMARHSRLCRFLHLPLQYGEDTILRQMNRHYDTAQFRDIAVEAARQIPGLCLGTDVIVGFPGETEDTFAACERYLEELPLGLMHVFGYSPRPGTPAATMKGRPASAVVDRRLQTLLQLSAKKAAEFAQSQLDSTVQVLVEEGNPATGWSDNYLHVSLQPPHDTVPVNTLCRARIVETLGERHVSGVLVASDARRDS